MVTEEERPSLTQDLRNCSLNERRKVELEFFDKVNQKSPS